MSNLSTTNIVDSCCNSHGKNERRRPFTELYPKEIKFFKRFWYWPLNKRGYYVRTHYYSRPLSEGKCIPKWQPEKLQADNGRKRKWKTWGWQPVADRLVNYHLAYEHHLPYYHRATGYCRKSPAFWLGGLPGETTRTDAHDLDSHLYVGYYHKRVESFGTYREVPVPKNSVSYFQHLKRAYDTLPNHIWMITSANLGKCLWRLHDEEATEAAELRMKKLLEATGQAHEIYPVSPKSEDSFGLCHRRPFGMDSALHTDQGLVTDPIEQIRWVMYHGNTSPRWANIFWQHLEQLERIYDRWMEDDIPISNAAYLDIHKDYRDRPKREILTELRQDVLAARQWFYDGCPLGKVPSRPRREGTCSSAFSVNLPSWLQKIDVDQILNSQKYDRRRKETPGWLDQVDLDQVLDGRTQTNLSPKRLLSIPIDTSLPDESDKRFWSWLVDLALNGLPVPDKLGMFIVPMARSLLLRDYFDLPLAEKMERAFDDLHSWVLQKHNGHCTRAENDDPDLVGQIKRLLNYAWDTANNRVKEYYAKMRLNDKRYPHRVQHLSGLISNKVDSLTNRSVVSLSLRKDQTGNENRVLPPDDSSLPDSIEAKLLEVVQAKKMRRRDGDYPFVRFSRRLLNAIWNQKGRARIPLASLLVWSGTTNPNQQWKHKQLLAKHGLIYDDWEDYIRRHSASSLYRLKPAAYQAFEECYARNNKGLTA